MKTPKLIKYVNGVFMNNERTDNIKPMAINPKKRSTKTNLPIRLRLLSNDLLKR